MYPLLVACKSISVLRQRAAQEVVDKIRQHSGRLVDQVGYFSILYFPFFILCQLDISTIKNFC